MSHVPIENSLFLVILVLLLTLSLVLITLLLFQPPERVPLVSDTLQDEDTGIPSLLCTSPPFISKLLRRTLTSLRLIALAFSSVIMMVFCSLPKCCFYI